MMDIPNQEIEVRSFPEKSLNAAKNKIDDNTNNKNSSRMEIIENNLSIESVAKVGITITTALYASGFLALNAHLSKFGYQDLDLASPRHLVVGGIVAIYFSCWYICSGRQSIRWKNSFSEELQEIYSKGLSKIWSSLALLSMILRSYSATCVAASTFSYIAYDLKSEYVLTISLFVPFLLVIIFGNDLIDGERPRLLITLNIVSSVITIGLFFWAFMVDEVLLTIFLTFTLMDIIAGVASRRFSRSETSHELRYYYALAAILFVALSSSSFGYFQFGEIKKKIGGGQPATAILTLKDPVMFVADGGPAKTISGKLIHVSASDTIILQEKSSMALKNANILGILIAPPDKISQDEKLNILAKPIDVVVQWVMNISKGKN